MTEHYYSQNPQVLSNPKKWLCTIQNKQYTFISDAGVFSKKELDFGSRLLIESFLSANFPYKKVLDVGCGYGVVGIAVASMNPASIVHMVDVNLRALELAKKNAYLNKVENIQVYESNLYEQVTELEFDAILSNPPIRAGKKVVYKVLTIAQEKLKIGGSIWVVIQKKQGAPTAMEKMKEIFGNVTVFAKKKGYYILQSTK